MRDAGYSDATAKNPQKLMNNPTFQDLAEQYLPDDMLLRALADDIEKKEGNRTPEMTLAFKVRGNLTERKDITSGGEKIVLMPAEVLNRLEDAATPETE